MSNTKYNLNTMPAIVNNLYTRRDSDWIKKLDENELVTNKVYNFIIQSWLVMDDRIRNHVRWLDKYVFSLPTKMYISLAWSILPKANKRPFITYIKKVHEEEEYKFILDRIRKHFELSDNDFNAMKSRLIKYIKNDMINWFSFYGIPKAHWKRYYLDYRLLKKFGATRDKGQKGLEAFGL